MEETKKTKVFIYNPYSLSEEEVENLQSKFSFLKGKKIENLIDKELLAGLKIIYGTKIIDLSLKKALSNLKANFYEFTK